MKICYFDFQKENGNIKRMGKGENHLKIGYA
jgi:hypothetical protein